MPWSNSRPGSHARYQTPEHRAEVKRHQAALAAAGSGRCAEVVCKKRSRLILPGMDLHLCHDRRTGAVLGLGHAQCNRSEAGRYARGKQDPPPSLPRWR